MNWYAYAGNNPVRGIDPEGLEEESWIDRANAWLGEHDPFARGFDQITNWATNVLWPEGLCTIPSAAERNPGLEDIYASLGRGEGFDAREATRHCLVAPMVSTVAGGAAHGLPELTGGVATGFRGHALTRMSQRGVSLFDVVDAINSPTRVTPWRLDAAGRWSRQYIGKTAGAAVNPRGEVVTVWSRVQR